MNKGKSSAAESRTLFIGELPQPFNGVSVKDKLMYEQLFRDIGAQMIDLVEGKRRPWKIPCDVMLRHMPKIWQRSRNSYVAESWLN